MLLSQNLKNIYIYIYLFWFKLYFYHNSSKSKGRRKSTELGAVSNSEPLFIPSFCANKSETNADLTKSVENTQICRKLKSLTWVKQAMDK